MATFYVTPTGSDSNNGTSISTSKLTINGAIQAISSVSYGNGYDQNTVKVYSSASGPATYYGKHASYNSNIINTSQGNKYGTTVIASGPHDVILDCSNKTRGAYLTFYSHISGFIFTASVPSARTTDSTVEAVFGSTQTRIDNCTFDNCTDTDSTCVSPGGDNTRSNRYDPWVKRCTFKNLDCTSAIYSPLNNVGIFESILIYDSTFDFQAVYYHGHSTDYGIVRHITIDGCTMGREAIESSKADIQNCIVSNCAVNSSFRFYDVLNSAEVDNCLAYNNTTVSGNFFSTGDTRNNCKLDDPSYTDRAGKDFTLTSGSPAKNTGLAPSVGSLGSGLGSVFDLNSASFDASNPSMGAYKFIAAAPSPTPVTVTFTLRGGSFNFKGNDNSFTIKG
tara:strand:+ start:3718 stop:4893 length:1176 start_codon:yes stop_codon:yes gene_type:complete